MTKPPAFQPAGYWRTPMRETRGEGYCGNAARRLTAGTELMLYHHGKAAA